MGNPYAGLGSVDPDTQNAADAAVRRLAEDPRHPQRDLNWLAQRWFSLASCFRLPRRARPTVDAIRIVARFVADPNPNVAVGALSALRSAAVVCDRRVFADLPGAWDEVAEARDAVARALECDVVLVRLGAAGLVAAFPAGSLAPALHRRLDDDVYTVRWLAVRALARIAPDPRLRDVLAASRPRTTNAVYDAAVEALRPR